MVVLGLACGAAGRRAVTVGFGALTAVAGIATAFAVYGAAMVLATGVPLTNPAIRRISLQAGVS